MRRLLWLSVLPLVGCAGWTGPRMRDAAPLQRVDSRCLPMPQKEQRAQSYLPYVNVPRGQGPRNWADLPEEQYGQRFN